MNKNVYKRVVTKKNVYKGYRTMAKLPNRNLLVLNKYYSSIHVCPLKRGINLLYTDCAEVIVPVAGKYMTFDFEEWILASESPEELELDMEREQMIKSPHMEFLAPRVIRLTSSNYVPNDKKQLRPTRNNILMRDNNTCQYCKTKMMSRNLNMDHVIPKSVGGKSTWTNLVTSCIPCNSRKGDVELVRSGLVLVRQPRKPKPVALFMQKLDPVHIEQYAPFLGIN